MTALNSSLPRASMFHWHGTRATFWARPEPAYIHDELPNQSSTSPIFLPLCAICVLQADAEVSQAKSSCDKAAEHCAARTSGNKAFKPISARKCFRCSRRDGQTNRETKQVCSHSKLYSAGHANHIWTANATYPHRSKVSHIEPQICIHRTCQSLHVGPIHTASYDTNHKSAHAEHGPALTPKH